jgi:Ca2+/Na+ antiporter
MKNKFDKYNFSEKPKKKSKYSIQSTNSIKQDKVNSFFYTIKEYIFKFYNFIVYHWTHNRLQFFLVLSLLFILGYYIYVNYIKKEKTDKENKDEHELEKTSNEYLNNFVQGSEYLVKNKKNKKKKSIPKKHETRCRIILENLFKSPFISIRPDFLKYPKTGKNLELDMYNEDLKLALEYDGIHHRKFTEFFHKTEQDFFDQQDRDNFKEERCKELGIVLIRVPDTVKFEDLEDYIKNELDKKGIFI